jgi:septum site-determining protein MinD
MSEATVYAVASGKGGVGKTTTTVNLGTALASGGSRVAIVDADLGMANAAGFLGLDPDGPTLHDVLADEATVPEATYEVADGIAVLPGSPDLEAFAAIDATGLDGVVDRLRDEFEYVLIDVGAGVSHEAVLPLGIADEVLVVSTPEPASAQDVRKTVELAETAGGSVAGLVVTRYSEGGSVSNEDLAASLDMTLLGSIPEDDAARESVLAGTPLVAHAPESPAANAYRQLAARLVDGEDASAAIATAAGAGTEDADDGEASAAESGAAGPSPDDADVADAGTDGAAATSTDDESAADDTAVADAADDASIDDAIADVDDAIAEVEEGSSGASDAAAAVQSSAPDDAGPDAAAEAESSANTGDADATAVSAADEKQAVTIPDADEHGSESTSDAPEDADDAETDQESAAEDAALDEDAIPFQRDDATAPPADSEDDATDADTDEDADDEEEAAEEEEGGFLSGIL